MNRKMIVPCVGYDTATDLAEKIAHRAYTIEGVIDVTVVHEFPRPEEPKRMQSPVPLNVWAELPDYEPVAKSLFTRFQEVLKKIGGAI
jgi:hypothetical protein